MSPIKNLIQKSQLLSFRLTPEDLSTIIVEAVIEEVGIDTTDRHVLYVDPYSRAVHIQFTETSYTPEDYQLLKDLHLDNPKRNAFVIFQKFLSKDQIKANHIFLSVANKSDTVNPSMFELAILK